MKANSASTIVPVMCALLALPGMADGAKDRIKVSDGDVVFTIDRFDDGRSLPYVVTFTDFGFKSVYKFNNDAQVSRISADGDDYTVKYRKSGKIKNVSRAGGRRDLTEAVEDGAAAMVGVGSPAPQRRLYACEDCYEGWDEICFIGIGTVCDLVTYGDPFLPPAETSLDVLCSTFGDLCEDLSAEDACAGQCEECLPPLTITLEWSSDSEDSDDPAFLDLLVIEPNNNLVNWRELEGDAGFISEYENKQVYTVFPELSSESDSDVTLGDYIAFAEWYGGSGPVSWAIDAVSGSGELLFSGGGDFSGECGSTTSESNDDTTSFATTNLFYGDLEEYVDNGCGVFFSPEAVNTAAKSARPGRV